MILCRNLLHAEGPSEEQVRDQRRRLYPAAHQAGANQAAGGDEGEERGGEDGAAGHDPGRPRHLRSPPHRRPPRLLQLPAATAGAEHGRHQLHLGTSAGDLGEAEGGRGLLQLHQRLQTVNNHNLQLQCVRPLHQQ